MAYANRNTKRSTIVNGWIIDRRTTHIITIAATRTNKDTLILQLHFDSSLPRGQCWRTERKQFNSKRWPASWSSEEPTLRKKKTSCRIPLNIQTALSSNTSAFHQRPTVKSTCAPRSYEPRTILLSHYRNPQNVSHYPLFLADMSRSSYSITRRVLYPCCSVIMPAHVAFASSRTILKTVTNSNHNHGHLCSPAYQLACFEGQAALIRRTKKTMRCKLNHQRIQPHIWHWLDRQPTNLTKFPVTHFAQAVLRPL